MIKVIAFDLVGVLVTEKDIDLSYEEDKLERMFGHNLNDSDYIIEARKYYDTDSEIIRVTEEIISKLYQVKDKNLFKKLKEKYGEAKIIIATNHVSFIRNYIGETLGVDYLDDVLISAEIHHVKPNRDFYEYILNKYDIEPNELLFVDDRIDNIDGARCLGINALKVDKDSDVYLEVVNFLDNIK